MTHKEDNITLDEQLATFTDKLLDGSESLLDGDSELLALKETVQRVHSAFGSISQDENASRRIQAKVMASWADSTKGRESRQPRNSFRTWLQANHQRTTLVVSFAVIVLLVIVSPWLSDSSPIIPGSAGSSGIGTITIVLGIVLIAVLAFGMRNKR